MGKKWWKMENFISLTKQIYLIPASSFQSVPSHSQLLYRGLCNPLEKWEQSTNMNHLVNFNISWTTCRLTLQYVSLKIQRKIPYFWQIEQSIKFQHFLNNPVKLYIHYTVCSKNIITRRLQRRMNVLHGHVEKEGLTSVALAVGPDDGLGLVRVQGLSGNVRSFCWVWIGFIEILKSVYLL